MKKIPMRMCVLCREMKPKKELIRLVTASDGKIILDETGKLNGRGAYVCKGTCVESLEKRKSFERALGASLADGLIDQIKGKLDE